MTSARLRVVASCAALSLVGLLGTATIANPAGAATTAECAAVVTDLQDGIRQAFASNPNVKSGTPAADDLAARIRELFTGAGERHPDCENAIAKFQAQLAAQARREASPSGTPFWGPVGWAWNAVYYKVFSANNIMMAMFGWALLLSPFILVFALVSVLRGSKGAFHRPYVPPHLRTQE